MRESRGRRDGGGARPVLPILLLAITAVLLTACGRAAEVQTPAEQRDRADLANPAADGEAVLEKMPRVNPPLGTGDARIVGSQDMTQEEFVQAIGADLNAKWGDLFESAGYTYSNADIIIYDGPIAASGCVEVAEPAMGPFYCPETGIIYYPLSWEDPGTGKTPAQIGDFAVAVILAHEMGHHVQNLLGVFEDPNAYSIQIELQADCFAGLWARSIYEQGILEPGDIGEAVQVAANAADLPGTDPTEEGAHGTESQRLDAFFAGYDSGDIGQCQF